MSSSRENLSTLNDDYDEMIGDAVGLGCALSAFVEAQDVKSWIKNIPKVDKNQRYHMELHR